jgi:predicted peroxiredoxin
MAEQTRELVVLMTHGAENEISSVGFTVANAGLTAGMKVYAFLTSGAIDLVRKGSVDTTHVQPLEPLKALINDFIKRGGTIWACPPCVKSRGYTQDSLIEGVTIQGASAMHERLKAGAAALSF